jgi:putative ATP-dependent endonuclease of OLD family
MPHITRLKLINFKRFAQLDLRFHNGRNILVGNNASGKSSILQAIELCLSANRNTIEEENLKFHFNSDAIEAFKRLPIGERTLLNLPKLIVELFLEDCEIPEFVGANNSAGQNLAGLRLILEPDESFGESIIAIISLEGFSFPFEFYKASFTSFGGSPYSKYSCPMRYLYVDHSAIGAATATNNYVKKLYEDLTESVQRNRMAHEYRQIKELFNEEVLGTLRPGQDLQFVLRSDRPYSMSNSVSIEKNGVDIMQEGKGEQSFVKIQFALERRTDNTHTLLIEEPENHLSHSRTMELLDIFDQSHVGQTIITTHSSLIASGLGLSNLLILSEMNSISFTLRDLEEGTQEFFAKAPDHLLLEFILANKVLLVEGAVEYILLPALYRRAYPEENMESNGIHLIAVGGIKFKRYVSISTILNKRIAIVQDNDGKSIDQINALYLNERDDQNSIINDRLHKLAVHPYPEQRTFEEVIYHMNSDLMNQLFQHRVRSNSVLDYMLANKTKVALDILHYLDGNPAQTFELPEYIKQAFEWLRN